MKIRETPTSLSWELRAPTSPGFCIGGAKRVAYTRNVCKQWLFYEAVGTSLKGEREIGESWWAPHVTTNHATRFWRVSSFGFWESREVDGYSAGGRASSFIGNTGQNFFAKLPYNLLLKYANVTSHTWRTLLRATFEGWIFEKLLLSAQTPLCWRVRVPVCA